MDWRELEEHALSVLQAATRASRPQPPDLLTQVGVLLVCGSGALLARAGILDKPSRKCFSNMCKTLFLPALLLAHVTASVSLEELRHWWTLPVFCTLYTLAGLALGWVVARVLRVPAPHVPMVMAAAALPNCSSIPLAVMDSLIEASPALAGDDPAAAKARSVSLILFYTLFMTVFRWTLGYQMLAPKQSYAELEGAGPGDVELVPVESQGQAEVEEEQHAPASLTARDVLRKVLNPPIIACLAAVVVGLVTPVKELFFSPESAAESETAPLETTVTGALLLVGEAYVPLVILVLGGNLSEGPSGAVPRKTLIGISLARLVAVPALATVLLGAFESAGLLPADPLLKLVLLLESPFPPAINLSVIVTLHGHLEKEMSAVLFWDYLLAVVTVPLWLLVFMPMAGLS